MVNRDRKGREPNLVDAIESVAGIFTEALGGTMLMAQIVSTSVPAVGNAKEGMNGTRFMPEGQMNSFGLSPERGG